MIELLSESTSVWQVLKQCNKPILIYGMGDGALKIMRVFEVYNIKISGFFASDEFVRGHSFCGFKVLTYAQACQQFGDFVIVLAFAGFREPLLSHIKKLNTEHEF
ncbi:MAG: FkbM family methyltransferase, partial [Oscillospiraceae bacterium]